MYKGEVMVWKVVLYFYKILLFIILQVKHFNSWLWISHRFQNQSCPDYWRQLKDCKSKACPTSDLNAKLPSMYMTTMEIKPQIFLHQTVNYQIGEQVVVEVQKYQRGLTSLCTEGEKELGQLLTTPRKRNSKHNLQSQKEISPTRLGQPKTLIMKIPWMIY